MLFVSGAQFLSRFGVLNTNIKTFVCGVYFKESLSVKYLFDSCPNIKFLNAELLSWLFLYCTVQCTCIYCHTIARSFFLSPKHTVYIKAQFLHFQESYKHFWLQYPLQHLNLFETSSKISCPRTVVLWLKSCVTFSSLFQLYKYHDSPHGPREEQQGAAGRAGGGGVLHLPGLCIS